MFSNGSVCELNNYISLRRYGSINTTKIKLRQDKGIEAEYRFIADVLRGKEKNDAIEDAFVSHRMIIEGMRGVK